jgi:hypothetical protein
MRGKPAYNDFWFKIGGSLVASQIIDSIGREESYFQRFTTKYFYTDLLGGFVIALLLWETVRFVVRYLDKSYDWFEKPIQRILLQLLLGVFVPALLSFFFTFAFMRLAYNQDIFKTQWLYNEFYAVILIIVLINLVYFTWWLYLASVKQKTASTDSSNVSLPDPANESSKLPGIDPVVEVTKAGKTMLLGQTEIACAYLNNGYCYIRTFQDNAFITSYTLEQIVQILHKNYFFRANRQMIVSRKSCKGYKSIENGKIELDLTVSLKEPVIVSQKRASEFRRWIGTTVIEA